MTSSPTAMHRILSVEAQDTVEPKDDKNNDALSSLSEETSSISTSLITESLLTDEIDIHDSEDSVRESDNPIRASARRQRRARCSETNVVDPARHKNSQMSSQHKTYSDLKQV